MDISNKYVLIAVIPRWEGCFSLNRVNDWKELEGDERKTYLNIISSCIHHGQAIFADGALYALEDSSLYPPHLVRARTPLELYEDA